ncbi:MAG: ABC transporter permease [Saprospiraceae bacterium]|nr:ABC transporter permease [Saprospiraceae bacterium]
MQTFDLSKHYGVVWATFVAFALAPLMATVFLYILDHPDSFNGSSGLRVKAESMGLQANWKAMFAIVSQAVGVGGIMVFGFVSSWLFGREYSDGTMKDLLALPVSRTRIALAKFGVYALWSLLLAGSNLIIGLLLGVMLGLEGSPFALKASDVSLYWETAVLTILADVPIAYFALRGKGYLAPLGFLALTLVLSQIVAAFGFGTYFPWSIPGIYSGSAGTGAAAVTWVSILILVVTALLGGLLSVDWLERTDQEG